MKSLDNWDAISLAFTETEAFSNLTYLYLNSSLLNVNASNNNNNHTNLTNIIYYPYYQHSLPVAASLTMVYLFIFLLCLVGNSLVCFIVLENRRMRTVTNLFILNLAVSDLLVGIFCIPTTLVDNLITGWPFSNMVCKMSGLVQGMSVASSIFTLVAIAIDRFRCIVYPFKPKLSSLVAKITITMIWVLAFVIMCPSAMTLTVQHVTNHFMVHNLDYNDIYPLLSCFENWSEAHMRKVYTTVLFAHIYLIPLAIITLMYGCIGFKLYTTSVISGQESGEGQNAGRPLISHKKIKAIKMLIVVALLFMLSWLPLWILMLLTDYGDLEQEEIEFLSGYVFPIAHWLAFSNSSVNPIIYGYYNENFKQGFKTVCGTHSWCCRCFIMPTGSRRDRRVRTGDRREMAVNSNILPVGSRNRVYTDSNLKSCTSSGEEKKKGSCRLSSSASMDNARPEMADRAKGVASQKGLQMQHLERISPTGMTVSPAWDQ